MMDDAKTKKKPRRYVRKSVIVANVDTHEIVDLIGTPSIVENSPIASTSTVVNTPDTSKNSPMPTRKNFTEKEEDVIIQFYSQNRFLWDHRDPKYKIAVKSASLQELVELLTNKFTAQEIHHRFSGMRTTYRNNVVRVNKFISTGAGSDDIYVPVWPHFESMKFLDDCAPNRESTCSITMQQLDQNVLDTIDLVDVSLPEKSSSQNTTVAPSQSSTQKTITVPGQKSNHSQRSGRNTGNVEQSKNKQAEVVEECLDVLRSVKDMGNSTSIGRCDSYGQYVASALKEMTSCKQTLAINEISNVLLKYDPNNPDAV